MVGYQGESHLHCETMFELRLCKTYRLNGTNLPTYTDNINQVNIIRTGLGITNDHPTRIINFNGRIMALSLIQLALRTLAQTPPDPPVSSSIVNHSGYYEECNLTYRLNKLCTLSALTTNNSWMKQSQLELALRHHLDLLYISSCATPVN